MTKAYVIRNKETGKKLYQTLDKNRADAMLTKNKWLDATHSGEIEVEMKMEEVRRCK